MDDKSIALELGDNRVLDFKRTSKTKFFKNGEELKSPKFTPGDQISVEGPEEPSGYMTAVNVYWEKAASAGDTARSPEKDKAEGVPDTWAKDAKDGKSRPRARRSFRRVEAAACGSGRRRPRPPRAPPRQAGRRRSSALPNAPPKPSLSHPALSKQRLRRPRHRAARRG